MRSPLTETIKRVEGMIAHVRENLDEGEYDLFLDLILPEPEPVKAAKKGRKKSGKGGSKIPLCVACGYSESSIVHKNESLSDFHRFQSPKSASKSSRASGMAAAIAKNLNRPREGACAYRLENGAVCNTGDNNPIHDESFGYAGYHEFQPVASPVAHEAGAGG